MEEQKLVWPSGATIKISFHGLSTISVVYELNGLIARSKFQSTGTPAVDLVMAVSMAHKEMVELIKEAQ